MTIFDEPINRENTDCMKYEKYPKNVIPAWVADMDFLSPKCIIDDLKQRVEHGVFGYTNISECVSDAVVNYVKNHYAWQIQGKDLVWSSGVVASMNFACNMFDKNSSIITLSPIYPYFFKIPKSLNQEAICVGVKNIQNRWSVDFDEFEKAIKPNTKALMLCNPFNPGGTVFTKNELEKFAQIALKHKLIIVSDEIHADLILDKNAKHVPIASLSKEIADITITLQAPSKTFNIAGLQSSYAIIQNDTLRRKFLDSMSFLSSGVNLLGLSATKTALTKCDDWLSNLLDYLHVNYTLIENFIKNTPLKMSNQQATYLAWIDARSLHVNAHELFLKHGVGLSDGKDFGGEGFVRLNFGCSKMLLIEILSRMDKAIKSID